MTPREWCRMMLARAYLDAAAAARLQTIVNRTPGYLVRYCRATQPAGDYELIIQDVQAPEWFSVGCWSEWATGMRRVVDANDTADQQRSYPPCHHGRHDYPDH